MTSPEPPDSPSPISPLASLVFVTAWLLIFNVVGDFTWGYGKLIFFMLMLATALTIGAVPIVRALTRLFGGKSRRPSRLIYAVIVATILSFLVPHSIGLYFQLTDKGRQIPIADIGENALTACRTLFVEGKNPYTHRCQLLDDVEDRDQVEVTEDGLLMYGVPYYYGYPYFPMMFLSFELPRRIVDGLDTIRLGNAIFYLFALIGVGWLAHRLAPEGRREFAALLAVLAFCGLRAWLAELFDLAVTDLVISVYALYGFIALSYGRYALAGIFIALVQASKVLPGPFMILVLLLWMRKNKGLPWFIMAFVLTFGAVMLPFIIWDGPAFLSATILYYMPYQDEGDDTSLWFFLPEALKTPFVYAGFIWTAYLLLRSLRETGKSVLGPLHYVFLIYLVFIAFSVRIHLNYLWSVYALGCVAVVVRMLDSTSTGTSDAST